MRCSPVVYLSIAIALLVQTIPATANQLALPKNILNIRGGISEDSYDTNNDSEEVRVDSVNEDADADADTDTDTDTHQVRDSESAGEDEYSSDEDINTDENNQLSSEAAALLESGQGAENALGSAQPQADSDDYDLKEFIKSKNAAGVQYMVTNKMRVYLNDLGYLDEEINDIEPQIAAVVIEQRRRRPSAGMPSTWRRGLESKSNGSPAKDAIARLVSGFKSHLPLIAATTLGGVAAYTQRGLLLRMGAAILSKTPLSRKSGLARRKEKVNLELVPVSDAETDAPITKSRRPLPRKDGKERKERKEFIPSRYAQLKSPPPTPRVRKEPGYRKWMKDKFGVDLSKMIMPEAEYSKNENVLNPKKRKAGERGRRPPPIQRPSEESLAEPKEDTPTKVEEAPVDTSPLTTVKKALSEKWASVMVLFQTANPFKPKRT